jgi:hypothetical protein
MAASVASGSAAVAGRVKGDARDFAQQQGNEKETGV